MYVQSMEVKGDHPKTFSSKPIPVQNLKNIFMLILFEFFSPESRNTQYGLLPDEGNHSLRTHGRLHQQLELCSVHMCQCLWYPGWDCSQKWSPRIDCQMDEYYIITWSKKWVKGKASLATLQMCSKSEGTHTSWGLSRSWHVNNKNNNPSNYIYANAPIFCQPEARLNRSYCLQDVVLLPASGQKTILYCPPKLQRRGACI